MPRWPISTYITEQRWHPVGRSPLTFSSIFNGTLWLQQSCAVPGVWQIISAFSGKRAPDPLLCPLLRGVAAASTGSSTPSHHWIISYFSHQFWVLYKPRRGALFGVFIECTVRDHITTEWKVFIHCQLDEQHMKHNLTLFSSQLFLSDYLVHLAA